MTDPKNKTRSGVKKCKSLMRSIYSHPAAMGETRSFMLLLSLRGPTGTALELPSPQGLQPWEVSGWRTRRCRATGCTRILIQDSGNIPLQANDPSETSCSLKEQAEKSGERKKNLRTEERSFESEMSSLITISSTTRLTPSKM